MHLEKQHARKKRRSSAGQRRLSYAHNAWWNDDSSWKFPLQNIFTSTGKETLFKDRNYCLFMTFKFIHSPRSYQTATGEYVFHVNSSLYCQTRAPRRYSYQKITISNLTEHSARLTQSHNEVSSSLRLENVEYWHSVDQKLVRQNTAKLKQRPKRKTCLTQRIKKTT